MTRLAQLCIPSQPFLWGRLLTCGRLLIGLPAALTTPALSAARARKAFPIGKSERQAMRPIARESYES
jgi:hypothetical protein